MTSGLSSYFIAFLLTVFLEVAVALMLGYRKRRELACIVLVNVCSHPLLHYIVWIIRSVRFLPAYDPIVVLLEAGVVVLEWQLFCYAFPEYRKKHLLLLSAIMNVVSYGTGLAFSVLRS